MSDGFRVSNWVAAQGRDRSVVIDGSRPRADADSRTAKDGCRLAAAGQPAATA